MTLLLLQDARRGFEDIEAGRTRDAFEAIAEMRKRLARERKAKAGRG